MACTWLKACAGNLFQGVNVKNYETFMVYLTLFTAPYRPSDFLVTISEPLVLISQAST